MNITDYSQPTERYFGGKPKTPKPPPAPDPVATPRKLDEEVQQRDIDKRRQRARAFGRGGTILTQGQPLAGQASATLLGRSTA